MKKPADEITNPVELDSGSPASDNANNGHGINSKSRNARAQARHRAKRKAYIEQLEESVTQLQAALNARDSEGAGPGPSSARLIELEQENKHLRQEINRLRGQLAEALRLSPSQTPVMNGLNDEYGSRDSKRRKRSIDESFSGSPVTPVSADGTKGGTSAHGLPPHLSHVRDTQRGGVSECAPTVLPRPLQLQAATSPTHSPDSYFRHGPSNHGAPSNALSYTSYQAQKALDPSYQVSPNTVQSFQNLHPEMFELRDASGNSWHQMYIQSQPLREVPLQHQLHYSTHQPHHVRPFYVANI